MNILVFGKKGQLASTLRDFEKNKDNLFKYIFLGRDEIDFRDLSNIEDYFKKYNPEIVINAVILQSILLKVILLMPTKLMQHH